MLTRCPDCNTLYNDENRWTICPHGPLGFAPDGYDPKTDTIRGVNHPDDQREKDAAEARRLMGCE